MSWDLTPAERKRLSPRAKTLLRAQRLQAASRAALERGACKAAEITAELRKARELSNEASELLAGIVLPELEALKRPIDQRIYGGGKPGARPCLWPDEAAPWNPDDPFLCRLPATKLVTFKGAKKGVPSCDSCAAAVAERDPEAVVVSDFSEEASS